KEAKPDVVIVGQNLGHNLDAMSEIATQLTKMGVKKVIFTGPSPHWTTDLPKLVIKKFWFNTPLRTYIGIDKKVLDDNADLQKGFKQTDTVKFVNLINLFCNEQGCLMFIGEDRKADITTWDYGHLTPVASEYLAKNILVKEIIGD
ncbi:MAG: SGNH hydrolase domain-containing protein, partial [Methylotenera sp.]